MFFLGVLVDLVEKNIEGVALSRKHLSNDRLIYKDSVEFHSNVFMVIIELSMIASLSDRNQIYMLANWSQYNMQEAVFITMMAAIPASVGLGLFL